MEKESIAYFYLRKNEVAKKRFYSPVQWNAFCVERWDRFVIKAIGIPEYYTESFATQLKRIWSKKWLHTTLSPQYLPWEKENLVNMLAEEFQKSGAGFYFFGEETALFLGQELPEVPLVFMEAMLVKYGVRENLILIGKQNPLFESIFGKYMHKVNFLKIICGEPEEYTGAVEWLYRNYGIVAEIRVESTGFGGERRLRETTGRKQEKGQPEMLVVDMDSGGKNGRPKIELAELPAGSIYMDMRSERAKAKWITQKRKDIHYLSPESLINKWCHLDTIAQNRYNTRVKLEVL